MNRTIGDIDQNLHIESSLNLPGIVWRSARTEPFQLYGLYAPQAEGGFRRMPEAVARQTNSGVAALHANTAGGRLRFRTDSPVVALKAVMPNLCVMQHMPALGSAGFDLYIVEDGEPPVYSASFVPPADARGGFESVVRFSDGAERDILIHLPLYSGVSELYIGLAENASLRPGGAYRPVAPMLFYGSSITQGGCASRPGNAYSNILSRLLNIDHLNLGFSGSALGEPCMAEYLASLDASVFVCDYDHNAPSARHLPETLWPLYQTYRAARPETPVVFVSKPDFRPDRTDDAERRAIVRSVCERAAASGDPNVSFVDGETLFDGVCRFDCTVDGCHPNDLGFHRMALVIGRRIADVLGLPFSFDARG